MNPNGIACDSPRPRGARRSGWIAILLLAAGCATTGINRGDVNLISLDDEWRMGQQLEGELRQKLRLVEYPVTVAYVSDIGRRIVRQTELSGAPWTFHVVADPEINAFATPGGHVYVNTGLIRAAGSTAELAGVLAHEIGHGVSRHSTERISKVYGLGLGARLLLGANPSTLEQIAAQIAAGGAVARFSRDDEREADRLGVESMYRAGYDPRGMAAMFEKLLAQRKSRPGSVQQFFATHPLAEERIAAVRRQAAALPPRPGLILDDGRLTAIQQRVARAGRAG
jgi:predicted Zn-dependent protease